MEKIEYYFDGVSETRLRKIAAAVSAKVEAGESHFVLKNGSEIEIYGSHNDWLVVNEDDREECFSSDLDLALFILKYSKR